MAREPDDRGFTLIELMVVVLIIAILLAIAIPTFLGARRNANERATQSRVRNAHTAQMIVYSDNQRFSDDPTLLSGVDPSLEYIAASPPSSLASNGNQVYVEVGQTALPNDTVIVGAKSADGTCFFMRTIGDTNNPRFGENDCSGVPTAFTDEW
jgi:type IV pilus assembly protein PilA